MKIIAEIGSTWWHPETEKAKERFLTSAKLASEAHVDYLKIQVFRADSLYAKNRTKPEVYEHFKKREIPFPWIGELSELCKEYQVGLIASVFSVELVPIISPLLNSIKIASGDFVNAPLVRIALSEAKKQNYSLLLSTGGANEEEIERVFDTFSTEDKKERIVLFQCAAAYPASPVSACLGVGEKWREKYECEIGFSDHTLTAGAALAACVLKYDWLERHVKTAEAPDGLFTGDYKIAISWKAMKRLVETIKDAQIAVAGNEKIIHPEEETDRVLARRGPDGLRPNADNMEVWE